MVRHIYQKKFRVSYESWGEQMSMCAYLLNVEKRKSNSFPKIIAIFTCYFEMLIEFFFDERIILHSYCIPHEILWNEQRNKKLEYYFHDRFNVPQWNCVRACVCHTARLAWSLNNMNTFSKSSVVYRRCRYAVDTGRYNSTGKYIFCRNYRWIFTRFFADRIFPQSTASI